MRRGKTRTLALMTRASFWLTYYSGTIKATLVLACLLGAALIGVGGLSITPGLLLAIATAIATCGGMAVLQYWINDRRIKSTRVVDHPEFGRIRVWRDHWDAQVHPSDLPYSCALSGTSPSGAPTQEQLLLWHTIRRELQVLLSAAGAALATELRSSHRPAEAPGLAAIMLLSPDSFVF